MNYDDAVKKSRYKTSAVTTIKEQAIIELGRNLNYLEESQFNLSPRLTCDGIRR